MKADAIDFTKLCNQQLSHIVLLFPVSSKKSIDFLSEIVI